MSKRAFLHGQLGALYKELEILEGARCDAELGVTEATDPEVVEGLKEALSGWDTLVDELKRAISEKKAEIELLSASDTEAS